MLNLYRHLLYGFIMGKNEIVQIDAERKLQFQNIMKSLKNLTDQRKAIAQETKDCWKYLKELGFDVKIVKRLLQLEQTDPEEIEYEEAVLKLYQEVLGDIGSTNYNHTTIGERDVIED